MSEEYRYVIALTIEKERFLGGIGENGAWVSAGQESWNRIADFDTKREAEKVEDKLYTGALDEVSGYRKNKSRV